MAFPTVSMVSLNFKWKKHLYRVVFVVHTFSFIHLGNNWMNTWKRSNALAFNYHKVFAKCWLLDMHQIQCESNLIHIFLTWRVFRGEWTVWMMHTFVKIKFYSIRILNLYNHINIFMIHRLYSLKLMVKKIWMSLKTMIDFKWLSFRLKCILSDP